MATLYQQPVTISLSQAEKLMTHIVIQRTRYADLMSSVTKLDPKRVRVLTPLCPETKLEKGHFVVFIKFTTGTNVVNCSWNNDVVF